MLRGQTLTNTGLYLYSMSGEDCTLCSFTKSSLPDDIGLLREEDRKIDVSIDELNTRRALIRRKINDLAAPACSLSPEILSTIFTYAYPLPSLLPRLNLQSLEADDFVSADARAVLLDPPASETHVSKPMILGAVCSYWRQVAWSTPMLWSALDLRPLPTTRSYKAAIALLHLYARNARDIGLKLQIVFHWSLVLGMDINKLEGPAQSLGDALCSPEVLATVCMLVLSNPPDPWLPHLSRGFINLRTLVIISKGPKPKTTVTVTNVPALRHVSLCGIRDSISLPFHQLLSMTLRDIPVDLMYELLLAGSSLVSYRTRVAVSSRDVRISLPPADPPISFHDLEHLEWAGNYTPWSRNLQRFRFPSLQYLHLHEGMPLSDFGLLPLFETLPSTLKTVHFEGFFEEENIMEILFVLPQVETVILEKCDSDSIRYVLQQIGRRSISPEERFVPHLRRLKIEGTSQVPDDSFPFEFSHIMVKALLRRTRAYDGPLCLEVSPATMVQWSWEVAGAFKDLIVHNAVPLKIVVEGEEVDWAFMVPQTF